MPNPIAPCGAGLLFAGCVLLNGSDARAQMSGAFIDAFAPKLQAPRSAPRFQKYDRDALAKLAETATFAPAGSGGHEWLRFNKHAQVPVENQDKKCRECADNRAGGSRPANAFALRQVRGRNRKRAGGRAGGAPGTAWADPNASEETKGAH
jgi:hypothetical protein